MTLRLAITILALGRGLAAEAQTPAEASALAGWEQVETLLQTRGARAAEAASTRALRDHPGFPPLWTQFLRLKNAIGGLAASRAARDSLAVAEPTIAPIAQFFAALEEGQTAIATEALAAIPPPPPGSVAEIFHGLNRNSLAIAIGDSVHLAQADSLLDSLEARVNREDGVRIAARYIRLILRQQRAQLLLQRGRGVEAATLLAELGRSASADGFGDLSLRAHYLSGRIQANLGESATAMREYGIAFELAERLGNDWYYVTIAGWWAWALEQQARYAEAFALRRDCAALLRRMGNPRGQGLNYLGLSWDAMRVGEIEMARSTLFEGLEYARSEDWTWLRARLLNQLGALRMNTGDFEGSMRSLEEGLELAENDRERALILNNLAILYGLMDRPDRSLPIYEQLLQIHRDNGDVGGQIMILNNLALSNESMGMFGQAITMYERSLELAERHDHFNGAARLNRARLLGSGWRVDEAESELRSVLSDAQRLGAVDLAMDAMSQLGRVLSYKSRLAEADRWLLRADSLMERTAAVRNRVPGLIRIGRVRSQLGDTRGALLAIDRAESLATAVMPLILPTVLAVRSDIHAQSHDSAAALRAARRSLGTHAEAFRGDVLSVRQVRERSWGLAIQSMLRVAGGDSGSERSRLEGEAFLALQRVKSRSLLEYVQGGQRAIEPQVPDSLKTAERRTRGRVDELLLAADGRTHTGAELDSLRLMLAEAQSEHTRARAELLAADDRYRAVATPAVIDSLDLAALLEPGVLVLDWLLGRSCEAAFECPVVLMAADAKGVRSHFLGSTPELERQIQLLFDLLALDSADDEASLRWLLAELGESLLGSVAERLGDYDRVIIAPDGVLSRLPFAALIVPGPESIDARPHLIERVAVQSVPSLAVLHELRRAGHGFDARWDLAIWESANTDLPFADQEARVLRERFPESRLLRGDLEVGKPLPEQLMQLGVFGQSKILHFIAHGSFDDRQPWRSGLYLQGGAGEEAHKLEIADVYYLDCRSELVTLSACETAGGILSESIGFSGFTQALLGSGATAVLATLWAIDDASSPVFMDFFYGSLREGNSPVDALRAAQLHFLDDRRLRHPRYWAAYTLIGDGTRSISLRGGSRQVSSGALLALGGLLLLAALAIRHRERSAR